MRPTTILAAALLLPLLSGCFGYPEGTVRPGDAVAFRYALPESLGGNADTGLLVVGNGYSLLGPEGEAALVGQRANTTLTIISSMTAIDTLPVHLDAAAQPLETRLPRALVGNASIGDRVILDDYGMYPVIVTGLSEGGADVRFDREDGDAVDIPQFGIRVRFHVDAEGIRRTVEPFVGARFDVTPQDVAAGSPFRNPGHHVVLGDNGEEVVFGVRSVAAGPVFEADVPLQVTILGIEAPEAGSQKRAPVFPRPPGLP